MPQAIACFLAQDYEPKELLVIAGGDLVDDLVPNDPRVRLVYNYDSTDTIGAKRNFGCKIARGELIAHFDDDDWSSPRRLADQVERLMFSGKSVTGYHTMKFTDGTRWCLYSGIPCVALGTSLLFRKTWWDKNRFPDRQIAEDSAFVSHAFMAGEMISVPACERLPVAGVQPSDLMYATIHPGNTSERASKIGKGYRVLRTPNG